MGRRLLSWSNGLVLLVLLCGAVAGQARSITTPPSRPAGAAGHQQQRVLQQQVYTEDPAALGAAAPPADAASALAAALGQPVPAAPVADSLAGAAVPATAAAPDVSAGAAPSLVGLDGQQQPPGANSQEQALGANSQDQAAGANSQEQVAGATSQQPSDFAYDMFETPAAASAAEQQQQATAPQPQQPDQQQQPLESPPAAEQLPASPPAAAAAAAQEEDQSTNPPNYNSELLPPEAAPPPSPQPSPTPADGGDGSSSGRNPPVAPEPPQTPPSTPGSDTQPWLNPSLSLSERINSLLKALTLEEKIPMMIHGQAGVPRLSLKPFQFWTECLHGHQERFDGMALPTIFPQPLMLAGTFDPQLAFQVFTAISDELRAKSNVELSKTGIHKFLTCWTPHINLFKDPRWGRGSETFGEDPYLTAAFAEHIVRGLQGQEASITKVVATCKHFLGYGLEGAEGVSRYSHNIDLSPQDLSDTDLPPFEACVQAAAGKGIMCSYNAVNGEPACASSTLLRGMLREGLGFDGYVVSDCNAVAALTFGHKAAGSVAEAAAASVKAGVDMLCDKPDLVREAVAAGKLTESDLDAALTNTLRMRFLTGQFDPPSANPWAGLPVSTVNSREHRKLARQVVHKGTVLLQNDPVSGTSTPILPLDKGALSKVCITGPLADSPEHMLGNYYGRWDEGAALTPKKAIKEELAKVGVNVSYSRGMDVAGEIHYDWPLESTLEACEGADVGLVFVGSSMVELKKTSEGDFKPATEGEGLDRLSLELPGRQPDLIKALARRAPGLPLVVVLTHGGGLDVAWMQAIPAVKAILSVPFPGQEGGRALVNLLFGAQSPSGRLPVTWYSRSYTAAVSPLNLNMRPDAKTGHPGRSYRFLQDSSHVLYPFGFGLSYTTFSYSGLTVLPAGADGCSNPGTAPAACIVLTVTNTGAPGFKKPAEHVVPLYLTHTSLAGVQGHPLQALRGVARTAALKPGESQQLSFPLSRNDFLLASPLDGVPALAPGIWKVSLGLWDAPLLPQVSEPEPEAQTVGGGPLLLSQQPGADGQTAASVVAAAPGALVGGQQQWQQQQQPQLQGAAAVGPAAVAYTGGPVALPNTVAGQQESGQRAAGIQPSRILVQEGLRGSADVGGSSRSSGSVAVDSRTGVALTITVPAELRIT